MFRRASIVKMSSVVVLFVVLAFVSLQCILSIITTTVMVLKRLENNLPEVAQWIWSSTMNCPLMTRNLTRHLDVDLDKLNSTENKHVNVQPGGRYKPLNCESRYRVAVIVPYRDREKHLKIFLRHMHPFLQRQHLDYGIYVVESTPEVKFNRGMLLNIGFLEANKLYTYDCVILHDVDLLPENDGIPYTCEQSPLHLSGAIDVKKYNMIRVKYVLCQKKLRIHERRPVNKYTGKYLRKTFLLDSTQYDFICGKCSRPAYRQNISSNAQTENLVNNATENEPCSSQILITAQSRCCPAHLDSNLNSYDTGVISELKTMFI